MDHRIELPKNRTSRWVSWWRPVTLAVLVSFAFAQPIFSILRANATFLLAHSLEGPRIVWYSLALLLVPTSIVLAIDLVGAWVGGRTGQIVYLILAGVLLGLTIAPPLNRSLTFGGAVSMVVLVVAIAAGIAIFRLPQATDAVRYAFVAPLAFISLFLFVGPASVLRAANDPSAYAIEPSKTPPIVWVIFDQLPLALLVDEGGEILEKRFPNFARLQEISTWFPNATTVAPSTDLAVPSALAGVYPTVGKLPISAEYPRNVFTLLAENYEIEAHETVTRLCPRSICGQSASSRGFLWDDTRTVMVRTLLADDVADRLVPEFNDRWAGFGDEMPDAPGSNSRVGGDDRAVFAAFLEELGTSAGPALHYLHQEKPHEPLLFLPDGRSYDFCSCYFTTADGRWPNSPEMLDQRMQQYIMQVMHVDRELGLLLDRLEHVEMMDEAVLVVMSDHGASLLPGNYNRQIDPATHSDTLPVPLFIRLPGAAGGSVDGRSAQIVDVLPTLLDALGVSDSGVTFDGESLFGPIPTDESVTVVTADGLEELDRPPAATESPMVPMVDSLLPEPDDPFTFGPDHDLVGSEVIDGNQRRSQLTAEVATLRRLADVDLNSDHVPAHVIGELIGRDAPVRLAVALNGTIAGVGSTFYNQGWRISIMADPRYLVAGPNQLGLFEVDDSGLLAIDLG